MKEHAQKIMQGKEVVFVYPFASPEIVDRIIWQTNAAAQWDLPLFHSEPLLHVRKTT